MSKNEPRKIITTNTLETIVSDVEKDAVIVAVQGWRMRIYGDDLNLKLGQSISVEYSGDIKDIHSIKLIGLVK